MAGGEIDRAVVQRAIARQPDAVRALIRALTPVVQIRVARALQRSHTVRTQGRSPAQDVEDMTQEVLLALFDDDARALRAWDPSRGASLVSFVGLVAEHQVASILRSGKRRPWRHEDTGDEVLEFVPAERPTTEKRLASRELYTKIIERLRAELSPRGLELFYALLVDEEPVDAICTRLAMSADAVYAWRSRLAKFVRGIAAEIESIGVMSDPDAEARRRTGALP